MGLVGRAESLGRAGAVSGILTDADTGRRAAVVCAVVNAAFNGALNTGKNIMILAEIVIHFRRSLSKNVPFADTLFFTHEALDIHQFGGNHVTFCHW